MIIVSMSQKCESIYKIMKICNNIKNIFFYKKLLGNNYNPNSYLQKEVFRSHYLSKIIEDYSKHDNMNNFLEKWGTSIKVLNEEDRNEILEIIDSQNKLTLYETYLYSKFCVIKYMP